MNEPLKSKNLLKAKDFFYVPEFIVLDYDLLKKCIKDNRIHNDFLSVIIKNNDLKNFILKNKRRLIVRSSTDVDYLYPGFFKSKVFIGIDGFKKAIKEIFISYVDGRKKIRRDFSFSIIVQKYVDGIKGNFYFDLEKNFFYLEFLTKKNTIHISFLNNNSYFSDFIFFDKYLPHLGIFYRECINLSNKLNLKKFSGEVVLSNDSIYLIQLNDWNVKLPDFDFWIEFENKYNYSFHCMDLDIDFFKLILKSICFKKEIRIKILDEKIFINFSDIFSLDLYLRSNIKKASVLFLKIVLKFIQDKSIKLRLIKNLNETLLFLKNFYADISIINFFYTRLINYYSMDFVNISNKTEIQNIENKFFESFLALKNKLKFLHNEVFEICYSKIKNYVSSIDKEKLKYACSLSIDDAVNFILDRGNCKIKKEKNKTLSKKIKCIFPLKGISLSSGSATGRIRIIKSYDDISKIKRNDIIVSSYFDNYLAQGILKALAAITSSGGYFSHIAVLSRKYNKPCVGGIWGCERIFKNGEKIKIKNEIIDKS
jgi:phosphohistidine swiveling domain-containing protein